MKKRIMIKGFLYLMLFGVAFSGLAAAELKTYINGFDADYPPFTFIDQKGLPDGFDVKAIDWIAKEMGFKVIHQPMKWETIIPTLNAKQIDMIGSAMSVCSQRKKQVNFSISYYKTIMVLVGKKSSSLRPEDAMEKGIKWGVQSGTSEMRWIEDKLLEEKQKTFKLIKYDSAQHAAEGIMNGQVDVAAISRSSADELIENAMPLKVLGGYGQPDDETAYAVRKEDAELLNKLNEGLKRLMASSHWKELKERYSVR